LARVTTANQWGSFLADLRFLACLGAFPLYAIWLFVQRASLVGLARLGLVIAFGATVLAYAATGAPLHALPFTDFFLFVLLAMFLILEFLFQMSVLGVLVAAIGTVVASMHYWWQSPVVAASATSPVTVYWWLLRDLAVTTGVAAMVLGSGTALLLFFMQDRRTGKLVHPNDLRDMVALLARGTVPCFFFGLAFQIAGVVQGGAPRWVDFWTSGWLLALFVGAIAWLVHAERRRFSGRKAVTLVLLNTVALIAYASEKLVAANLTGGPSIP
jgi:hypothetical protein